MLIVDIDPQGNTTSGIGINKADVYYCIYDVIINDVHPKDAIVGYEYTESQNHSCYDSVGGG